MSHQSSILFQLIFVISFAIRLFLAIFFDVSNEEAYFRTATFHHSSDSHIESPLFQWIYFWFGQMESNYWFRMPSIILLSLSIVLLKFIGERLFNWQTALLAIVLLHFIPFITLNASFTLPHALFLFLFTATWLSALKYIETPKPWLATTLSLLVAAGYLTNPIFLFVLVPIFIELNLAKKFGESIKKHGLAFLAGLLSLIPAWFMFNEYFSLKFLDTFSHKGLWLQQFQEIVLWFSPWFLIAFIILLFQVFINHTFLRGHDRQGTKSTIIWSIPLMLMALCWHDKSQSMLLIMVSITGLVLALAFSICTLNQGIKALMWKSIALTCCLLSFLFIAGIQKFMLDGYQINEKLVSENKGELSNSIKNIILSDYVGHVGVEAFVEFWNKNLPQDANFVFTDSWQLASQMNSISKDNQVLCFNEDELRGYAFWNRSQSFIGKNGYLIIKSDASHEIINSIKPYFRKVQQYRQEIPISRNNKVVTKFIIFRCTVLTRPFPS